MQILITTDCTTRIGSINSAAYIPTNFTGVVSYNGTCNQCICFAFISNNSSNYQALNCYLNNGTCLIFPSFTNGSYIYTISNSKLTFLQLPPSTTQGCILMYGQCGGGSGIGIASCCNNLSCIYYNTTYSYCGIASTVSTNTTSTTISTTISTTTTTTTSYVNDTRQNATLGTYWACCKASCGWPGKAFVTSPVRTCEQDGTTVIGNNTQSICDGGGACACINQQPWNVSSYLSYSFAGAGIIGRNESQWCCACYSLMFTSGPIIGKEMIVQVINTAYPINTMFVLQIPGGGWGSSVNGCPNQFGGSYSWGDSAVGISDRSSCSNLPVDLQPGCYWRFDWFMNASDATVRYREVSCPSILTNISGCERIQ